MPSVTREEYRRRLAQLRPIMAVFRGRLECAEVGGSAGAISLRTRDGKELHVGGAVTPDQARAIVAAVNFVIDLGQREARDDGGETRRPGRDGPR